MKFTRKAPGYYTATASTTMTKDGNVRTVEVAISIVRMPEWTSAEKWYVEVTVDHDDYVQTLCDGARGDSIHFTLAEAKAAAEASIKQGWTYYRGGGFSCWAAAS